MAKKRMISNDIVDSDAFLDMPVSSQLLYFHLNMRADDEGFVNKPKSIMRICGSSNDDLKLLIAKSFIINFETGVIVIKHWRINNTLRKDRLTETMYKTEKSMLFLKANGSYTLDNTKGTALCQPLANQMSTTCQPNVSIGEGRVDKISIDKISKEDKPKKKNPTYIRPDTKPIGEFKNVYITDKEKDKLLSKYGEPVKDEIESLSAYIENTDKGKKYKNHYATLIQWCKKLPKKVEDNEDNSEALAYFTAKGDGKEVDIENIDF